MRTIPPTIRGIRSLIVEKRLILLPKRKKDLGMFYLHNASINPADIFPKDMPEKLCANSLARDKSVTSLIVTLLNLGRLRSSNARQSLQLPIISSKKM
jgi:hypothetical protein